MGNKEAIEFLIDLQNELKTQDKDSQAEPRFWVIMDYRIVPTHEDYDMDYISYYHNDGDHTEFKTVEDLKEFLDEYYLDSDNDETSRLQNLLENDNLSFEELWEFVTEHLSNNDFFNEVPVKKESYIVPDTMFLTKEEARNHLKSNRHHYTSKAHTYAMTAWRAPKVGKLLEILETFDFKALLDKKSC